MTPSFRFPLHAGGTNPCAVPLAKRGEPYGGRGNTLTPSCRFPLKTGGTEPVLCAVPLAKRGEP
jgi:hypothetical protein